MSAPTAGHCGAGGGFSPDVVLMVPMGSLGCVNMRATSGGIGPCVGISVSMEGSLIAAQRPAARFAPSPVLSPIAPKACFLHDG